MLKYFLKPLVIADVLAIVLIVTWFFLYLFNKCKGIQTWIFWAAHTVFYLSKMFLYKGNFFLPSAIILFVSGIAAILSWINRNKEDGSVTKNRWIYYFFTFFTILSFCYGCLLIEARSVLMPPLH